MSRMMDLFMFVTLTTLLKSARNGQERETEMNEGKVVRFRPGQL